MPLPKVPKFPTRTGTISGTSTGTSTATTSEDENEFAAKAARSGPTVAPGTRSSAAVGIGSSTSKFSSGDRGPLVRFLSAAKARELSDERAAMIREFRETSTAKSAKKRSESEAALNELNWLESEALEVPICSASEALGMKKFNRLESEAALNEINRSESEAKMQEIMRSDGFFSSLQIEEVNPNLGHVTEFQMNSTEISQRKRKRKFCEDDEFFP